MSDSKYIFFKDINRSLQSPAQSSAHPLPHAQRNVCPPCQSPAALLSYGYEVREEMRQGSPCVHDAGPTSPVAGRTYMSSSMGPRDSYRQKSGGHSIAAVPPAGCLAVPFLPLV